MLSYQHSYHAGNLADVHKHALLAWMLEYLTRKDKALSYIETHSGRGIYDLSSDESIKTGEAAQGIKRLKQSFAASHPYRQALDTIQKSHGDTAYPGSPLIAETLLRPIDLLHLGELHPQEHEALTQNMRNSNTQIYHQDGYELAQSICPPDPRRGLMLIDPSWEVKTEYATLPRTLMLLRKKWNVGILVLWYPLLEDGTHRPMIKQLCDMHPDALRSEVSFPPARKGHRMIGSGLFVINPPWGLDHEARDVAAKFKTLR